ncbi:Organic solute transporter subunit alpha [Holothuria leucospilota]|uniref:Organic solute transporter subunit alpha n=1 Tax=Holothuria leucospilota TaxID=206669 RepID=A0A9Q1HGF8_HOLLE|nr:Organic solute transporter subunit alpha [Holothuria leucospilota]
MSESEEMWNVTDHYQGSNMYTTVLGEEEKPQYPFGCDGPVLIQPTTEELMVALSSERTILIMLAFAIGLTVLTVGMFLESLVYVCRKIPSRRKVQLAFIMGIYPVFCITALMAILVPNAALLTHFTSQMPTYKKFIRAVRFMVIQTAVFKPCMLFIGAMLWSNGNYFPGNFSGSDPWLAMEMCMLVSSMIALNGIIIMFRISKDPMKEFHLTPKFFTIQLTLILTSVQGFTISLIVYCGGFACRPPFIPAMRGLYYNQFLTIFEMFFFNLFATVWFRRLDGNLDEVQRERRLSKYARFSNSVSGPPGINPDSKLVNLNNSLEGGMDDFDEKIKNNNSRNLYTVEAGEEKTLPFYKVSKNGDITTDDQKSEYEGEADASSQPLMRSDSDRETNV